MDPMKRVPLSVQPERSVGSEITSVIAQSESSLSNVLKLVGSLDELDDGVPPTRRSSAQDWSKLIERIRYAASHVREVETQAHEQELRVQELLERVREDMNKANAHARAANTRAAEMQARSEALLKAADERVKLAEERARIAEEWLARVYETIASEFTIEQDKKLTA